MGARYYEGDTLGAGGGGAVIVMIVLGRNGEGCVDWTRHRRCVISQLLANNILSIIVTIQVFFTWPEACHLKGHAAGRFAALLSKCQQLVGSCMTSLLHFL